MDWETLLSARRISSRKGASAGSPDHRNEFQRDWDRVIFSTAFRRLHDKTQVFPLPENDVVHSRLTHSLEVASVGRSLGTLIGKRISIADKAPGVSDFDIGNIVAAACLAHDIGNPPFGHAGEDALRTYFAVIAPRENGGPDVQKVFESNLSKRQWSDIREYEGNAQGFRIVTRLQFEEYGGLRLTAATLGAFLKYPRESGDDFSAGGPATKKFGVFQSEMPVLEELANVLQLLPYRTSAGGRGWRRHPLAYVVEAADDICNAILDLEDGCRLGCLTHAELDGVLERLAASGGRFSKTTYDSFAEARDRTGYLRALAIGELVEHCARVFESNERSLMRGEPVRSLIHLTEYDAIVAELKTLAVARCYLNPSVLVREAAGYAAIHGLLRLFVPCVTMEPSSGSLESRVREFLSQRSLVNSAESDDIYGRVLRVLDYVGGMTDSYVISSFRGFAGITT